MTSPMERGKLLTLVCHPEKVSKAEEQTKLSINIGLGSNFLLRTNTLAFCQIVNAESKKF
jgi:hypothetical protein